MTTDRHDPHGAPAFRAIRPMGPRDPEEAHRAATPLELFFDLVFVVAVAQAAAGLHHGIAEGHAYEAVLGYAITFFGVWWAWVNFTWFASAYDSDDVPYRLAVFVQMTGALIFAAGVPALAELDLRVGVTGYVLMRVALVAQWIRAGLGHPEGRPAAFRYALGVALTQAGWVGLVFTPIGVRLAGFIALAMVELAVPAWAERASRTPWHAEHIRERFGLFTIIVLGESVLAATLTIQAALAGGGALQALLPTIGGGLLLLYSMWWLYFDNPPGDLLRTMRGTFAWGYGHYVVLGAAAAVGAGLAVATDAVTHHAEVTPRGAAAAVIVPVALYVLAMWLLHGRAHARPFERALAPLAVVLLALCAWTPQPVLAAGLVLAAVLGVKIRRRDRIAAG